MGSEFVPLDFDRRLMLQFRGSVVTSDAGLLAYRELDDALGLTVMASDVLADARTGKNGRHALAGLFRQSVFGRLAGYEDVNDAERLRHDAAMRSIVGGKAAQMRRSSPLQDVTGRQSVFEQQRVRGICSQMQRFESRREAESLANSILNAEVRILRPSQPVRSPLKTARYHPFRVRTDSVVRMRPRQPASPVSAYRGASASGTIPSQSFAANASVKTEASSSLRPTRRTMVTPVCSWAAPVIPPNVSVRSRSQM